MEQPMSTRSAFPGVALMLMLAVPLGAQTDRPAATAKPQGPMPNFTGTVAIVEATDVRGVRFRYDAGARSYWHVHDGSLVLLIEQGRGRFQIKGQPIREFGPGEPIVLPANVPHWHGALTRRRPHVGGALDRPEREVDGASERRRVPGQERQVNDFDTGRARKRSRDGTLANCP